MFRESIDLITINNFDNYGVAYELNKVYYLYDNTAIGFEDNRGNYFFALKGKTSIENSDNLTSCGDSTSQEYTFYFVTTCSSELFLYNQLNTATGLDTDNIDNVKITINSITETNVTSTLLVTEIQVTLKGNINDCVVEVPCCC